MPRPSKVTAAISKQIKDLRAQSLSIRRIAVQVGLADSVVFYALYGKQPVTRRSQKSEEKRVACLKCDRPFETKMVGHIPRNRICPKCALTNEAFAGALC